MKLINVHMHCRLLYLPPWSVLSLMLVVNEAELCFLEWGRIDFYMCNDLKTACYICFAFVVTVGVMTSSPGLLWNDLKCATALHDSCLQVVQNTHSFTQLIPAHVVQCTHSFTLLIPTRVETWESVW